MARSFNENIGMTLEWVKAGTDLVNSKPAGELEPHTAQLRELYKSIKALEEILVGKVDLGITAVTTPTPAAVVKDDTVSIDGWVEWRLMDTSSESLISEAPADEKSADEMVSASKGRFKKVKVTYEVY